MARRSVNPEQFDAYKNFSFRVKWGGRYVAGVSEVCGLKRSTEVSGQREGADPFTSRKLLGRTKYEAITLKRGVTHDPEFVKWGSRVRNSGSGLAAGESLRDLRKDVAIEAYDVACHPVMAYEVFRCWVSELRAMPRLDADACEVAIEVMKLENEGWEPDRSAFGLPEPELIEP